MHYLIELVKQKNKEISLSPKMYARQTLVRRLILFLFVHGNDYIIVSASYFDNPRDVSDSKQCKCGVVPGIISGFPFQCKF